MTDARDPSAGGSESRLGAGAHAGPVSRDGLLALIAAGDVETVVLAAPDRHARLFGKRVHAPFFAEDPEQGMMTCSVNVAWDLGQDFVGHLDYTGWHTGYHDMRGRPDMETARVLPWAEKTALILCDLVEEDGADIPVAPRTMLRRQLDRAAAAGFTCKTASELEFHVFREDYDAARAKGYRDLTPAPGYNNDYLILAQAQVEPFLADVRRVLTDAGVPVECSKGEWGWGQTEVNLRYAEALESADRHVLYKEGVKELAQRHGLSATFMALPFAGTAASAQPPSGSSCHIHVSLWDPDGAENRFAADGETSRDVAALPRRPDALHPRAHAAVRAERELVQAAARATSPPAPTPGATTTARWRSGWWAKAPRRASRTASRSGRQPLPRLRGDDRLGTLRHRARARTWAVRGRQRARDARRRAPAALAR